MSKFLLSAAATALMTAPALAQADEDTTSQNRTMDAGDQAQDQSAERAGANSRNTNQAAGRSGAVNDDGHDWRSDHDWVQAAVYSEDGEQIGVVDRVRMRPDDDAEVRAIVLDTDGFLDQGMRHIRLLGDEATVITQDALPQGWTVSRTGSGGRSDGPDGGGDGEEESDTERRWWNWGGDDDDDAESDASQANAGGGMDTFTLITLDFTNDEIGIMPEYTAPAGTGASMASADADTQTSVASDTTEGDAMNAGESRRADARQATRQASRTAREEASGEQEMAANAGQTGDPMGERSGEAMSDEDSEDFQSENGNEIGEDASDGYDRERRAGRDDYATGAQDTGVNQDGNFFDDSGEDSPGESMDDGSDDMGQTDRADQAGDEAEDGEDGEDGDRTMRDRQSGQSSAQDETQTRSQGAQRGTENRGDAQSAQTGSQDARTGQAAGSTDSDMASDQSGAEQGWSEDSNLVGQDVYAQDDTRLGSVGQVRQGGEGTDAEPIALIIITDTMGERQVLLEDRDWSDERREGEQSLTLDYQDEDEFEEDSRPYGGQSGMTGGDEDYGEGEGETETDAGDTAYGREGGEDSDASNQWTDDHDWVDTPVYSRTGEQIGDVERVRGGETGAEPTAIVVETGGFLDLGGREVELNGSNFRLTDYEGEQVLQIRYTEDEVDQMEAFDESRASDFPLSDNPLEDDESEPMEDETR
ncbi:MAG: PRC-barrel domain-containing protein [Oceanicaulis sp.]